MKRFTWRGVEILVAAPHLDPSLLNLVSEKQAAPLHAGKLEINDMAQFDECRPGTKLTTIQDTMMEKTRRFYGLTGKSIGAGERRMGGGDTEAEPRKVAPPPLSPSPLFDRDRPCFYGVSSSVVLLGRKTETTQLSPDEMT